MARKLLLLAVALVLTSWASVQADPPPPPPCDCFSCFATPNALCDANGTVFCADWWPPNCNWW